MLEARFAIVSEYEKVPGSEELLGLLGVPGIGIVPEATPGYSSEKGE